MTIRIMKTPIVARWWERNKEKYAEGMEAHDVYNKFLFHTRWEHNDGIAEAFTYIGFIMILKKLDDAPRIFRRHVQTNNLRRSMRVIQTVSEGDTGEEEAA